MALTRKQICIEQSNMTTQGKDQTGVWVWLPLGTEDDEWLLHDLMTHPTAVGGVACWDHGQTWACKCAPGSYIEALVGATGLAFPGGNWSIGSSVTTYSDGNGWRYIRNAGIASRNMRLTVPANTTRLYMIPYAHNDFGTMLITLVSGSATIVTPSLNIDYNGAGMDIDNMIDCPVDAVSAGPSLRSLKLIATDCGGAVLNFIGDGAGPDAIGCCGFICINDNGAAAECNPYDGVMDPATLVEIMPARTALQLAEGPVALKAGVEAVRLWGGGAHWDADDTLINGVQTLYFQDCDDDSWVDWTSVDTDDTRILKKAYCFVRTLTGDMQYDIGGSDTTIGTYTGVYSFTPAGVTMTVDHQFNAAAAAGGLKVSASNYGGYGGQWSIIKGFAKYIRGYNDLDLTEPYEIQTGTFVNNTSIYTNVGDYVCLYGGPSGYEVHIQGGGMVLSGGGTIGNTSPSIMCHERVDPDGTEYVKAYLPNQYVPADITIADGDRVFGKHSRIVTPAGGLSTYPKRVARMSKDFNSNIAGVF